MRAVVLVCWLACPCELFCSCRCKVRSRVSDALSQALRNLSLAFLAYFILSDSTAPICFIVKLFSLANYNLLSFGSKDKITAFKSLPHVFRLTGTAALHCGHTFFGGILTAFQRISLKIFDLHSPLRLVSLVARIITWKVDCNLKYCNPRCACAPRVNNPEGGSPRYYWIIDKSPPQPIFIISLPWQFCGNRDVCPSNGAHFRSNREAENGKRLWFSKKRRKEDLPPGSVL